MDQPPDAMTTDDAWALVAPYRARLIALARSRGLSLPDAQDVAHHVMYRAVERRPLDPARIEAYLVRATVARCQDVHEDEARQEQYLVRTRGDDRLVGRLDEAVCDRAQVRWLLDKLPVRERRVVLLSVNGETVTGIAKATGLSYPTVDRLLSRARKEMRRLAGLLGVAGLAVWRHRRLAFPAGATTAVAVASISILVPPAPVPRARVAAPRPAYVVAEGRFAAARPHVAHRTVARPIAAPADASWEPDTEVVRHEPRPPAVATVPRTDTQVATDESAVERVQDCVKKGATVEVGTTIGVDCGDGTPLG